VGFKNLFLLVLFSASCLFSASFHYYLFEILAAERLAVSFYLIDLSCDVLFEIRRFVACFIFAAILNRVLEQFPELFVFFLSFSSHAS
jgi:hypothetical protein